MNTTKPLTQLQTRVLDIIYGRKIYGAPMGMPVRVLHILRNKYRYNKSLKLKQVEDTIANLLKRGFIKKGKITRDPRGVSALEGYVLTDMVKLIYRPQEEEWKDD